MSKTISSASTAKKKKSYREYLSDIGDTGAIDLAKALRQAEYEAQAKSPSYGTSGEQLGRSGLLQSGYGAYLSGLAYADKQTAKQNALLTYQENDAAQKQSYADYLTKEEQNASSRISQVLETLSKYEITDKNKAYRYALSFGLSDAEADIVSGLSQEVAQSGSDVSIHQKRTILSYMLSRDMSYEDAYVYAVALGLSDTLAKELAEASARFSGKGTYKQYN